VATDAARHDGAQLPNLISRANTGSEVFADTAYRSKANEKHLSGQRLVPFAALDLLARVVT
jgi:IS5 family transposase